MPIYKGRSSVNAEPARVSGCRSPSATAAQRSRSYDTFTAGGAAEVAAQPQRQPADLLSASEEVDQVVKGLARAAKLKIPNK